jgi:hypothetical protein
MAPNNPENSISTAHLCRESEPFDPWKIAEFPDNKLHRCCWEGRGGGVGKLVRQVLPQHAGGVI